VPFAGLAAGAKVRSVAGVAVMHASDRLRPYVPGFVLEWLRDMPTIRHREVEGTLAFVDISGFTRLTERLAARGKVGAEEMSELLDRTFAELLAVAYARGAWLVKWGGDAVLLLFQDDGHAARAVTAAVEMRRTMDVIGRLETSCGRVRLRVSTGVHSGRFDVFLVGVTHHELVIAGPEATTTALTEAAAAAGEVGVSAATAALLPPGVVRARADGLLLAVRSPGSPALAPRPPASVPGVDVGSCLPLPTRQYLLAGEDDAEHRLVAVAFVEFSGTDALLLDQGPGATAAAIDAVVQTCQRACETHGVTFWETDISKDGGKVMLVAGAPGSTGDEEDALLAAAREVVEAGGVLSVRVGVNSGRVFFGQFGPPFRRTMSVKGDAVNLAARLMARAAPGEVLASAAVVARARTPFATDPLPPFHVKGKLQPVVAARVGPARRSAGPVLAPDAPPLLGRERELGRLRAEWRIAQHGSLRLCHLVGDAGVGKSRLVQELVSSIEGTVVEARSDRHTSTSAYAPFRRLLRDLLPGTNDDHLGEVLLTSLRTAAPELLPWAPLIAAVIGGNVPATAESAALDDRFRAQRQEEAFADLLVQLLPSPTVIVLDDAHLLDASSASLLARIATRAATAPWLVIACRRGGDATDDAVGVTLPVGPLARGDAFTLLHALTETTPPPPREAAALVQRAAGNPLFLVELAAATVRGERLEDLPDSVEHIVAARMDRLRPADRRLLRAAAVVGIDVERRVLEALSSRLDTPLDPESLARLSEFLEPVGPERFRFRQALVQEAAYEGLPYSRRRVLHGHVADVVVEQAGGRADEHAALLSLHFLRAERYAEAWRYAGLAAERARAVMAHAEAADLYQRAIAAAGHLPSVTPDVAASSEGLGDMRTRLGEFAAAGAAYAQARRSCRDSGAMLARLHYKSAVALDRMGAYRQALRWLTTGRRLLGELPSDDVTGRLAAEIAVEHATIRHWQGRHRDAVRACQHAIDLAERVGAGDVLADALVWLDVNELMLGTGDGAPARRALEMWQGMGDRPWHEGRCLNELGIRAYFAGQWDDARRLYRLCEEANERAGDAWAASVARGNAAEILSDQGRLDEAEPLLRDALRVWRASAAPSFIAFGQSALGRLAARAARYDEALGLLTSAREQYVADGETAEVLDTDARLAECHLLRGASESALAAADEAIARAEALPGLAPTVPMLHRLRGLALAAQGEADAAHAALERSLAAARARHADHEVAFTLHAMSSVLIATRARVPAELRREQADLLAQLGIVTVSEPALPRTALALPVQVRRELPAEVARPAR
jgi:class 3 adenylate cyclase/tetratricopeptide (TPR) repeat protein